MLEPPPSLILVMARSKVYYCRVHVLAGTVDASDTGALARAEETYIANLKYAADKCAEVAINKHASILCE